MFGPYIIDLFLHEKLSKDARSLKFGSSNFCEYANLSYYVGHSAISIKSLPVCIGSNVDSFASSEKLNPFKCVDQEPLKVYYGKQ